MRSVEEQQARITAAAVAPRPIRVAIAEAQGLMCAEDVVTERPLPGFDQDPYIAAANFDARPWDHLISEFEHVRRSTILFFEGLTPEETLRRGVANDAAVSVRALGYVIACDRM